MVIFPRVASASAGNAFRGSWGFPGGQETMKGDARVFTSFGSSGVSNGEGKGNSARPERI